MNLLDFIENSFGTIGEINYENGYIEFEILDLCDNLLPDIVDVLVIYNKENFIVHVSFSPMLDFVTLTIHSRKSGRVYFIKHYKYKVIEE